MPISYPPDIALREFVGSTTRHTRRVEIYESDGVTRWLPPDVIGDVARKNLAVDPRGTLVTTAAGPRFQSGRWGAECTYATATGITGPDTTGITTAAQYTVVTARSSHGFHLNGNPEGGAPSGSAIADITAGDTVTISCWIRKTGADGGFRIGLRPWAAGVYTGGTTQGSTFTITGNLWTRVWMTYQIPVGSTDIDFYITGTVNDAIGDVVQATGLLVEKTNALNGWFDGSVQDNSSFVYDWTSTVNNSTSTLKPVLAHWDLSDMDGLLVDGAVTVDYSRAERRALDLTLANEDNLLQSAPGKFWYDKILKVFRGVRINERLRVPKILLINDRSDALSVATPFRKALVDMGYGDVRINQTASIYELDGKPFDIIISLNGSNTTALQTFLKAALDDGKSIMAFDSASGLFTSGNYGVTVSFNAATTATSLFGTAPHPINTGWTTYPTTTATAGYPNMPVPVNSKYTVTATVNAAGTSVGQAAIQSTGANPNGRGVMFYHWIDPTLVADANFQLALKSSMAWLNTVAALATWETQIGEFMIDRISEDHFPNEVQITGRDYTKKCMLSKYVQATQFTPGQTLEGLITSISGAAGITKRALPATGITVGRTFFFDRGVTRWDAMKEICSAYDYDIYFDATGYLVIKPYSDPSTTAPTVVVATGDDGVLATFSKSTTDTRIYNSIVVTGESADATTPNVFAVAKNTNPLSPTRIAAIGERVYQYTSSFITTTAQAQAVADSFLAVHALEEFELGFESLMMPWLEVGDIMGFVDPNPAPGDPTEFLISSISIPIALGPMSAVGKRVTNVS